MKSATCFLLISKELFEKATEQSERREMKKKKKKKDGWRWMWVHIIDNMRLGEKERGGLWIERIRTKKEKGKWWTDVNSHWSPSPFS